MMFSVFFTCPEVDEVKGDGKSEKHFDYKFYIQNIGRMGTFLYRDPMTSSVEIPKGKWYRLGGSERREIFEGDLIGILMKKPDYK